MTISAFQIALVLYFAVGLRIGWTGQLLVLLIASALVCLAAFFFVSLSDGRFFLHYVFAAIVSDVVIQVGFVLGLLTASRSDFRYSRSDAADLGRKSWLRSALTRIDDRGMPNTVFSRLTSLAERAGSSQKRD